MRRLRPCLLLVSCLSLPAFAALAAEAPPFEPAQAKAWFDEAHRQCAADNGKLWGKSLCGPAMFVDPATRRVMANQADAQGLLKPEQGVFVGRLPDSVSFANTALDWAGVRWSQLVWPMPADAGQRRVVMAHEAFHRIQADVGLAPAPDAPVDALDTLQGRYLVQLEWRALAKAVAASSEPERRRRVEDALLFRAARYRQFPEAAAAERALERNEGVAEYTGVAVGAVSPAERLALTEADLTSHVSAPSYIRSFEYATGPGYGWLLDHYVPSWRQRIREQPDATLSDLLSAALHAKLGDGTAAEVERRAADYDGATLLAAEKAREQRRQQEVARYRAQLVDGPRLVLPLRKPQVMFNPSTLVSLGDAGTVYPTMKVITEWGSIEVTAGALLTPDWKYLYVPVPGKDAARAGTIAGPGWTLKLADGWRLKDGQRQGDMTLDHDNPGAP